MYGSGCTFSRYATCCGQQASRLCSSIPSDAIRRLLTLQELAQPGRPGRRRRIRHQLIMPASPDSACRTDMPGPTTSSSLLTCGFTADADARQAYAAAGSDACRGDRCTRSSLLAVVLIIRRSSLVMHLVGLSIDGANL